MKDVHTILKDARTIMAERGMAKGRMKDNDGSVCLRGALITAGYGDTPGCLDGLSGEQLDLLTTCELAMGFVHWTGDQTTDAALWNNAPERTLEEVLDRFDEGIAATAEELVLA